jgi:hypothetical protein
VEENSDSESAAGPSGEESAEENIDSGVAADSSWEESAEENIDSESAVDMATLGIDPNETPVFDENVLPIHEGMPR